MFYRDFFSKFFENYLLYRTFSVNCFCYFLYCSLFLKFLGKNGKCEWKSYANYNLFTILISNNYFVVFDLCFRKDFTSRLFNSFDVSVLLMNIDLLLRIINVTMNCIFPYCMLLSCHVRVSE